MPNGVITTGSLADSLPLILDNARIRREYPTVVSKLSETHKLDDNTGLSWEEVELSRLTAQSVTETTILENGQEITDLLNTYTPTISGITTIVTDRVYKRITKAAVAQMGGLAQEALERKKDVDGIASLVSATNSQPGAGSTLTSGVISAHVANITGNTTEGATGPIYTLLHAFQRKDLQDEIVAGIGTYAIPAGLTEQVYRDGFSGSLFNTEVYIDNNISIDASDDAKGAVFAKMGHLYIQGMGPRKESKRRPEYGGGADQIWLYDEYTFGERLSNSSSVFVRVVNSDATAPTT